MAKKKKFKDSDILKEIRENLRVSSDMERDNREASVECQKFENGDAEVIWGDQLEKRKGRPCPAVNRGREVVTQVCGASKQNEIGVSVHPDGSVDETEEAANKEKAELYEGIIRDIEVESSAKDVYDYAHNCAARGGIGYYRILTEYIDERSRHQTIRLKRIVNPQAVYFGPANEITKEDAMWAFITETVPRKDFEKKNKDSVLCSGIDLGVGDYEQTWISEKTVTIAEYFRVVEEKDTVYFLDDDTDVLLSEIKESGGEIEEGQGSKWLVIPGRRKDEIIDERETTTRKIEWYKTNGAEILEGPTILASKYIPIVPMLGDEVWIDGKQVLRSAIQFVIEPARNYNFGLANVLEVLGQSPKQPILADWKGIENFTEYWNEAANRPFPYLPYDAEASKHQPIRLRGAEVNQGAISVMQLSIDDMKATGGSYNTSQGELGAEISGRAIIARQKQMDNGTYVFHDNKLKAVQYGYKIIMDLIPKIIDTERKVKMVTADGKEKWVIVNKKIENKLTGEVKVERDIRTGKYSVVANASMAYASRRMEAADGMSQMLQSAPMYAQVIVPRLAKNLDIPEADEIAEEMKQLTKPPDPPPEPPPDPKMQMAVEKHVVDMDNKSLDVQKKRSELNNMQQENMQQMASLAQQVTINTLVSLGIIPPPQNQG
jgi:hypothetical protein